MTDYRTYAFRRFKRELTHLSRLRWVFKYCQSFVTLAVRDADVPPTDLLTARFPVPDYPAERLSIPVQEFCDQASGNEDHFNLLLLVKACANMEHYLHKIAQIWAIEQGYFDVLATDLLDKRGKALIKPARVSTLDDSLKYIELLLSIEFGSALNVVRKAYKLRCVAAHTGGVVDEGALTEFPELKSQLGDRIHLSWDQLNSYLKSIQLCCSRIENSIPKRVRMRNELKVIIGGLIRGGVFGDKQQANARGAGSRVFGHDEVYQLRNILVTQFGFNNLPSVHWLTREMERFIPIIPNSSKPKSNTEPK